MSNRGVIDFMGLHASAVPDRTITSAGIDWISCSSESAQSKRKYLHAFSNLSLEDRHNGYAVVPAGFHGFAGNRTRHGALMHRGDRSLFMVSGRFAQRHSLLAAEGDNCSRIDVQVTIQLEPGQVPDYIKEQHERVRSFRTIRGHTQNTEMRVINGKPQTLYVGSRASDLFVRIYDKYEESKEECYKDCVRLEIEYKGKRSAAIWQALAVGTLRGMSLLFMLLRDLSERGIDTTGIDIERQDIRLPKPKPSKESVTWGWWASQVAPSVARSVAERGWYTAFSILFRECLSEIDKTCIMNAISLQWGD